MRLFLLYDEVSRETGEAVEALASWAKTRGHEFKSRSASEMDVKPCMGCFNCWVKTPGLCGIRDGSEVFHEAFVKWDATVILTKIPFGSYSPAVKRVFDRMIPTIHPDFRIYRGEMHHKWRYPHYARLLHAAYGPHSPEELETFAELASSHCDNIGLEPVEKTLDWGLSGTEITGWIEKEMSR